MTTETIELTELGPTPAAVVRGHVAPPELPGFLSAAYTELMRVLRDQHRPPAGPPFARYRVTGDGFDVEAGFPSGAAVDDDGRVTSVVLPGGPAVTAVHRGAYETVGETYDAIAAWMDAHGYRPAGEGWEAYLDEPGVAEPRTLVCSPCTRD